MQSVQSFLHPDGRNAKGEATLTHDIENKFLARVSSHGAQCLFRPSLNYLRTLCHLFLVFVTSQIHQKILGGSVLQPDSISVAHTEKKGKALLSLPLSKQQQQSLIKCVFAALNSPPHTLCTEPAGNYKNFSGVRGKQFMMQFW